MRHILLAVAAILLAACTSSSNKPKPAAQLTGPAAAPAMPAEPVESRERAGTDTRVEMANVNIHLDTELILHIRYLTGKFLSTKKGQPPTFDDKLSYVVAIDTAKIGMTMASMTHAMNTYVFSEPDAPLKNLQLSAEGSQIRQKGTLRKGPGLPFEILGTVSATPDGKIRIHPAQMKVEHLPVKGLMKLFGVDMAKLINTRKTKGVTVDENDIILDPALMLPPPQMRGRITEVRMEGDEIVQIFGQERPDQPAAQPPSNYMAYRGGILRFGRLTMTNVDMQLIDAEPKDPFEFFPDHYSEQLVAGYSKTTATGGLRVYMPDYDKVGKGLTPPIALHAPNPPRPGL